MNGGGSRLSAGAIVAGALFAALGAAFLLDALGAWDVSPGLALPALVIGLGAALLIDALYHRDAPR